MAPDWDEMMRNGLTPYALLLVVLIGCGTAPRTAQYEDPLPVEAAALIAAYDANELAADAAYKGRLVRVGGSVREISKDILGDPYVILVGNHKEILGVQCSFPAAATAVLSRLKKGDRASFDCRIDGKLMYVQAGKCAVNFPLP